MKTSFSVLVNGEIIGSELIDKYLASYLLENNSNGNLSRDNKGFIKAEISNSMINDLLLVQYAKLQGLSVDTSLILEKTRQKEGLRTFSAYSKAELRALVEGELIIHSLMERIMLDIVKADDGVLLSFYEANKYFFSLGKAFSVRHILVRHYDVASDLFDKKALDMALYILGLIRSGEDFAIVAKEFSECESKDRGGDLGFIYKGVLGDDAFEKALFNLDTKMPLDIIESSYGYHVVEVLKTVDDFIPPFVTIKDRVRVVLLDEVKKERKEDLIEELFTKAAIEYIDA